MRLIMILALTSMAAIPSSAQSYHASTQQQSVFVSSKPETARGATALAVTISASVPLTCSGDTVKLSANASGGSGTYTYKWASNPAGFNATVKDPAVTPLLSTTYTVTVNDGATTATATYTANVDVVAVPTITLVGNALQSTSAFSYQWYWNGTLVTGANTQQYVATDPGSYQVVAIDINGCLSKKSTPYTVTGIETINEQEIHLYPNPVKQQFSVFIADEQKKLLRIIDANGQVLLQKECVKTTAVSVENFPKGRYLVQIGSGNAVVTKQLLIE
ncbi:MAG: T9SS type A sorting domain-containing protein [Chitinophagales bacterium]